MREQGFTVEFLEIIFLVAIDKVVLSVISSIGREEFFQKEVIRE